MPLEEQELRAADAAAPPPSGAIETALAGIPPLPADTLILVPTRSLVLFPGTVLPVTLGRQRSIAAAQAAIRLSRPIGLVLQRDPATDDPIPVDLHRMGTEANILRYLTSPDGQHHVISQGERRVRILDFVDGYPFLAARVERVTEAETTSKDIEARMLNLRNQAIEVLQLLPQTPAELVNAVQGVTSPAALADLIASFMDITPFEKQEVLETVDLERRLDRVSEMLAYRTEVLRLSRRISEETQGKIDTRQREFLLREQLKTIQKELGEGEDAKAQEIAELSQKIAEAKMPEEVEAHAKRELARLERMPEAAGEYSMARSYLEWLTELPWSVETGGSIDIAEARRVLDADHFGLAKVKRRILEYLAIHHLNPEGRSPILCFVGPPGVGKTSLGQSIARATGRKFVRVSLGGTHDEAEIRGHRRTYIGALPGNIIQGIRRAGSRDCVMMLDEVDKLGRGIQGDPASALLEVLDPEQNSTFRDNYLGVPFDLSRVMFITTANVLDTVPGPLRDRMEIIDLPGYVEDEKFEIAKRYLVGRQLKANGLKPEEAEIADAAIHEIIRDYTREAGVRQLEREIGAVLRSAAMKYRRRGCAARRDRTRGARRNPRPAALRGRGRDAHQRPRCRDRPRLDPGRRRHPVYRGDPHPRRQPVDPDGPTGRGHARERAGRLEPRQIARRRPRPRPGDVRKKRHPHPRPGRRHPERRALCRGGDVHRLGVVVDRPHSAERHGDDRRDQPARPRAAGRRHQGKGHRRRPRRPFRGDPPRPQPQGLRRHPRKRAQRPALHLGRARRRRDQSRPRTRLRPGKSRRIASGAVVDGRHFALAKKSAASNRRC